MTEPVRRKDPPAQVAKFATAGVSGVFVFGLTAVMGWSERSIDEPDVVPEQPPSTSAAPATAPQIIPPPPPTTSLVPLATTIPAAPAPVAVPAPPPVAVAPAPAPPPPAPVVVSEQSQ